MRRELLVAFAATLAASISFGQQTPTFSSSKPAFREQIQEPSYLVGPGVTSPELLPMNPPPVFSGKCKKQDDSVEFTVIVDSAGVPGSIFYSRALATDLDKMALEIVRADRFMPGTHGGRAVAVEISVKVELPGCVERVKDSSGQKTEVSHLRSQPVQEVSPVLLPPAGNRPASAALPPTDSSGNPIYRVGGDVSPPAPLSTPEAKYTTQARKARIMGICVIRLIVNTDGIPESLTVTHSLDPGLDQNALEAVSKYRFKPAMKGDKPVPVVIAVEVNFMLY